MNGPLLFAISIRFSYCRGVLCWLGFSRK